jgi:hypothetical protein
MRMCGLWVAALLIGLSWCAPLVVVDKLEPNIAHEFGKEVRVVVLRTGNMYDSQLKTHHPEVLKAATAELQAKGYTVETDWRSRDTLFKPSQGGHGIAELQDGILAPGDKTRAFLCVLSGIDVETREYERRSNETIATVRDASGTAVGSITRPVTSTYERQYTNVSAQAILFYATAAGVRRVYVGNSDVRQGTLEAVARTVLLKIPKRETGK